MYQHRRISCLLPLCLLAAALGCAKPGPPVTEVRGTVTYNGDPATVGTVQFIPSSLDGELIRPASGAIAPDGTYQISAFPGRNGSRPGEYRVAIVAYTGSSMDGTAKYVVPQRYADPHKSGLKATVPDSATEPFVLDFHLVN